MKAYKFKVLVIDFEQLGATNRLEDGTIIAGARHWDTMMRDGSIDMLFSGGL